MKIITNSILALVLVSSSAAAFASASDDCDLCDRMTSNETRTKYAEERITAVQDTLYHEGLIRNKSDLRLHGRVNNVVDEIKKHDSRISQNSNDIEILKDRMDKIDTRMNSIVATSQAVTAARPYLTDSQNGAIGVGMGMSGSESAVSIGYAQRITANWTANANVATADKMSFGLGTQYSW